MAEPAEPDPAAEAAGWVVTEAAVGAAAAGSEETAGRIMVEEGDSEGTARTVAAPPSLIFPPRPIRLGPEAVAAGSILLWERGVMRAPLLRGAEPVKGVALVVQLEEEVAADPARC